MALLDAKSSQYNIAIGAARSDTAISARGDSGRANSGARTRPLSTAALASSSDDHAAIVVTCCVVESESENVSPIETSSAVVTLTAAEPVIPSSSAGIYVHVAENHRRDIPQPILEAAEAEPDPDRRILKMLAARGKDLAKTEVPKAKEAAFAAS